MLYFLVNDLWKINQMYYFSLKAFVNVFLRYASKLTLRQSVDSQAVCFLCTVPWLQRLKATSWLSVWSA